jgi:hypothetical protein
MQECLDSEGLEDKECPDTIGSEDTVKYGYQGFGIYRNVCLRKM